MVREVKKTYCNVDRDDFRRTQELFQRPSHLYRIRLRVALVRECWELFGFVFYEAEPLTLHGRLEVWEGAEVSE